MTATWATFAAGGAAAKEIAALSDTDDRIKKVYAVIRPDCSDPDTVYGCGMKSGESFSLPDHFFHNDASAAGPPVVTLNLFRLPEKSLERCIGIVSIVRDTAFPYTYGCSQSYGLYYEFTVSSEKISELIIAFYGRGFGQTVPRSGKIRSLTASCSGRYPDQLSPVMIFQYLIRLLFIGHQIFFFSLIEMPGIVELIHVRDICFLLLMLLMEQVEIKHLFRDEPVAPVIIERDAENFLLGETVRHSV